MSPARHAIVLGGGIAGLSAAIALRGAGYKVAVHEQAEAIAPLGAAISLWPNAVAALRHLGVADAIEAEAAPLVTMLLATQDGRPVMGPWAIDPARHGERAYLPTRALIQRALQARLGTSALHLGRRVATVEDRGAAAAVTFADGETIAADLIVAADGIRSATGTRICGNPPRACSYGGVLALSDPADGPPLDGLSAEYWGRGERFGVFDLGGGRRYWFYMQGEPAPTPRRGALLAKAASWPTPIAAAIAGTPEERLIPISIHARPIPRRLGAGRIVAVGDAAHAMEPNLGQGACQALEDAVALGGVARRVEPGDLAHTFDQARRRRVAAMMRRAAEGGQAAHGSPAAQIAWRSLLRLLPTALHRRVTDGFYRLPSY